MKQPIPDPLKRPSLRTRCLIAAAAGLFLFGSPSSALAVFDPLMDEMDEPILIDNFTDGLSKWTLIGANVTITESGGQTFLRVGGSSGVSLNPAHRIPLPEVGSMLVVDMDVAGRWRNMPQLFLSNGDGVNLVELGRPGSGSVGTGLPFSARLHPGDSFQTVLPIAPTTTTTGEDNWNTIRFIFDNRGGDRVAAVYVKPFGESQFQPYVWNDGTGDPVTRANAWATSAPMEVYYRQHEGGVSRLFMDYIQYQVISDPSAYFNTLVAGVRLEKADELRVPTELGRAYQVQRSTDGGQSWANVGGIMVGDGTNIRRYTSSQSGSAVQYRVLTTQE